MLSLGADEQIRPPIFVVHGQARIYACRKPQFLQALAKGQKMRMFELPGIRGGKYPMIGSKTSPTAYIDQLTVEYPRRASICWPRFVPEA